MFFIFNSFGNVGLYGYNNSMLITCKCRTMFITCKCESYQVYLSGQRRDPKNEVSANNTEMTTSFPLGRCVNMCKTGTGLRDREIGIEEGTGKEIGDCRNGNAMRGVRSCKA